MPWKKWGAFVILLYPAAVAFANPVVIDPGTVIGLSLILGPVFALEALVVTAILLFSRMEVVPSLIALFVGNIAIYFIIFKPLLSVVNNILVAEMLIVIVEGIFIKIISFFDAFQTDDFKGLKWRTAFIASAVGNALSYYAGIIIGR
jgi:uncharacterized membrane protein